ncbi:MAG: hypothetical protein ACR2LC_16690 [Pyrinomonadaceae bacterium]
MDARTERMIETKTTTDCAADVDGFVCDATVQLLQARIALDEMGPLERKQFIELYAHDIRIELLRVSRCVEILESALTEACGLFKRSEITH